MEKENQIIIPLTNEAALKVFQNENYKVRSFVDAQGNYHFVAQDVCNYLMLGNNREAVARLDEDEKGVTLTDTPGGVQEMLTVTEAGLYRLIGSSRKPEAKAFQRWIYHEVLPSIRKTGSYSTKPISTVDGLLAAVQILKEHEDRLNVMEQKQQEQQTKLGAMTFIQNNQQRKLAEVTQIQQEQDASLKDLKAESTVTSNRLAVLETGNQHGAKYYPYPDGKITQSLLNRIWNMCTKLSQQLPEYDRSPEMWHVKYKEVLLAYLRSENINIHKELVEAKQYYTQVYTTEKAQGITPAKEVLRPADIKKVTLWQVLCLNPEYIELANAVIAEFDKHLKKDNVGGEN